MNIEKLNILISKDFSKIIQSENNVKYKIVIPFLQSFNHVDLDLEHAAQGSRIDINIGNRIIIETKALGINLNHHVQQLSNYSGRELPVLAILTNGSHFLIYSPQWRQKKSFQEKVIYDFHLNDLVDIQLVNRLERILDFSNYQSEEFITHVEQREVEIIEAQKVIDEIKKAKAQQLAELTSEIIKLKEEIKEKEKIVAGINADRNPEVEDKIKKHFLPVNKSQTGANSFVNKQKVSSLISIVPKQISLPVNNGRQSEIEIEKVKKRVPKWFRSPNQANHKILVKFLELLGREDSIPLFELQSSFLDMGNFQGHYSAMKSFGERNHGKVFDEINKNIFLWEPVKNFIQDEYRKFQGQ